MERSLLDEPLLPMIDKWITDPDGLQRRVATATTWVRTRFPTLLTGAATPEPRAAATPTAAPTALPTSMPPISPGRLGVPLLALAGVCLWCVLSNVLTTGLASVVVSATGYLAAGAIGVIQLPPTIRAVVDRTVALLSKTPVVAASLATTATASLATTAAPVPKP